MPEIGELYGLLTEKKEERPEGSEFGEDPKLVSIARNIVTMFPDAPDDPKEAAAYVIGVLKRLIKSKATLTVAFRTMSRPGKEKAALRKMLKRV
jgi:hypothetical protein